MGGRSALVALGLGGVLGLVALSAEKAPEAYSNVMKGLAATAQSLRKNVAVSPRDYDALARDAMALQAAFATAETFWTERNVADAIQISKDGSKAATDLGTAVMARNDEAIAQAATAATGTCAACHMAHRVRNEDGTYEIK
jgi:hypothetical protein